MAEASASHSYRSGPDFVSLGPERDRCFGYSHPVPLAAYLPLQAVYAFHESAETWILRRYDSGAELGDGAERTRPAWSETPIAIFRDRTASGTRNGDPGQAAPQTCTVYTRTRLLTTQDVGVQACDVLFDANPSSKTPGAAWQATASGDWDEALGYAVTLTRAGVRGAAPWV